LGWDLTEEKYYPDYYLSNPTEHDPGGIVNTIHFRMAQLELTDDVVGLPG